VVVTGAFTKIVVFEAEESIKFNMQLPPPEVSMPTVQPLNRKVWKVPCNMLMTLTPVLTSRYRLAFLTETGLLLYLPKHVCWHLKGMHTFEIFILQVNLHDT
jgi:hypothetical protein